MSSGEYTGGREPQRRGSPARRPKQPNESAWTWVQPGQPQPPEPPTEPSPASATKQSPAARKRSAALSGRQVLLICLLGALVIGATIFAAVYYNDVREPRETLAPLISVGETADFVDSSPGAGEVTVLEHRWATDLTARKPGNAVLAVQLRIKVTRGRPYIPHMQAINADGYRWSDTPVRSETYPRLKSGDLRIFRTVEGWVFFELPQQDVTFLLATGREESLRIAIPGGPVVPAVPPPIPLELDATYVDFYGTCRVEVRGASWGMIEQTGREKMVLGVLLRVTPESGRCPSLRLQAYDRAENELVRVGLSSLRDGPVMVWSDVYSGDSVQGWFHFETARQSIELEVGVSDPQRLPIPAE